MLCPKCGQEMENGNSVFISTNGIGQMLLTFTSEEEAKKNIFKRKSFSKMLLSASQAETYHCSACKIILPLLKED